MSAIATGRRSMRALVLSVTAAVLAALVTAAVPTTARAAGTGSIVYIKGHNVWVATPDGKKQHRVTADGTATLPYVSPSQSDGGVIAAGRGNYIITMRQNGEVIRKIDPPALMSSISHPLDGAPVDVAISPDGKKIAWTYAVYQCVVGTTCMVRSATGVTDASGPTPVSKYGSTYFENPSWVTNSRLIQNGGYYHQINLVDAGGATRYWFDDYQVAAESTDLGDADVSPDGKWLAAVRGYGSGTHIVWYRVNGDPRSGAAPGLPEWLCMTSTMAGLADPSWSPGSDAMVWQEPDGVWLKTNPGTCDNPQPRLLIAGGSQPDWSAAPLAPPARQKPQPKPQPKPKTGPGATKKITARSKARVVGTARVGKKLRARAPKWSVKPTKVRYQWYRGGKAIKRATKATYRLTAKDRGKRISVRVKASRAGYKSAAAKSKASVRVKAAKEAVR